MVPRKRQPLRYVLGALRKLYGAPKRVEPRTAFEMVLFENASYLVADDVKRTVFTTLARRIGTTPDEVLRAKRKDIVAAIAKGGMLVEHRADKVVRAARAARAGLEELVKRDLATARKALKTMPSIGGPGADKIALFVGGHHVLPLDSNGLRVLARLGFAREGADYAKTYRAVQAAIAHELPGTTKDLVTAHLLLRAHGRAICTRTRPACSACPLAERCPSAQPSAARSR